MLISFVLGSWDHYSLAASCCCAAQGAASSPVIFHHFVDTISFSTGPRRPSSLFLGRALFQGRHICSLLSSNGGRLVEGTHFKDRDEMGEAMMDQGNEGLAKPNLKSEEQTGPQSSVRLITIWLHNRLGNGKCDSITTV